MEYASLSDAVKEVLCVVQLMEDMKIVVMYPVMVKVDNIGAIFMANNITTMSCTNHMDIRYKYVNEYVEDGLAQIVFVTSADNDSNILTIN